MAINILDENVLEKVLHLLQRESNECTDKIIKLFPFHQLVELEGMNHRSISLNSNILKYLIENDNLILDVEKISASLDFIFRNLTFLIKQTECGSSVLQLLDNLKNILIKLNNATKYVLNKDLCKDLCTILNSPHVLNDDIKLCCCSIMMEMLSVKHLKVVDMNTFVQCVSNLLIKLDKDLLQGFQIINGILQAQSMGLIPEIESIYDFTECNIRKITKENDSELLFTCFKCISYMLKLSERTERSLNINELLLRQLDLILFSLKMDEFKYECGEILMYLIKHVFHEFTLVEIELQLKISIFAGRQDWDSINDDFILVIYYMEFIYLNYTHEESLLTKRLSKNISTYPITRKATYLFFAAYIAPLNTHYSKILGNVLLDTLHNSTELDVMLTYHISQLIWILCQGSKQIKMKVLLLWIKNHEDEVIIDCIKACKASNVLVDIVLNSTEASYKSRAQHMILQLKEPSVSKRLLKVLPSVFTKPNILQDILILQPAIPNDSNYSTFLTRKLLYLSTNIENVRLIFEICNYCSKILISNKRNPSTVMVYIENDMVRNLLILGDHPDEMVAIQAVRLLKYILMLQTRHKINSENPIEIEFSNFLRGSSQRINISLNLLQSILTPTDSQSILKLPNPPIDLYHRLLGLRNVDPEIDIYRFLIRLIRKQKSLALSIHNILVVKCECKLIGRNSKIKEFLRFVVFWLDIVRDMKFIDVPVKVIRKYLKAYEEKYIESLVEPEDENMKIYPLRYLSIVHL